MTTSAYEYSEWKLKTKNTAREMGVMVSTIQNEAESAIMELNEGLAKMAQKPLTTEEASTTLVTTLKLVEHLSLRASELVTILQQMNNLLPTMATILDDLSELPVDEIAPNTKNELALHSSYEDGEGERTIE